MRIRASVVQNICLKFFCVPFGMFICYFCNKIKYPSTIYSTNVNRFRKKSILLLAQIQYILLMLFSRKENTFCSLFELEALDYCIIPNENFCLKKLNSTFMFFPPFIELDSGPYLSRRKFTQKETPSKPYLFDHIL